jgi:hypothetical protein
MKTTTINISFFALRTARTAATTAKGLKQQFKTYFSYATLTRAGLTIRQTMQSA